MKIPTVKVYKDGREVVINESDLGKWQEQGFSIGNEDYGEELELQSMKKYELAELAEERGIDTKYMNKSDIIEALNA